MGKSDEEDGRERPQVRNADLRVAMDEIGNNVTDDPKFTRDELILLFELMRD